MLFSLIQTLGSTATMVKANARDPIPPGWKLVDLKLLGKYVSLAKKVIGGNSIVRLDGGWKFYGSHYGYQLKKSDHFMPKVVKDQLLINEKGRILNRLNNSSLFPCLVQFTVY